MERDNLIFKIMFVALVTTTAFSMELKQPASSSSSSSNETKMVTLQGDGYSMEIPIDVAKVSQTIAYDIKDNETKQGKSVTIKIPSQISKKTLSKIIKIMELVAQLQKQEHDEGYIILAVYRMIRKEIANNVDVILAANDLGCSHIFKALILALKHKAPVDSHIKSYPYTQALNKIKAKYSSAKSKSSDDDAIDYGDDPIEEGSDNCSCSSPDYQSCTTSSQSNNSDEIKTVTLQGEGYSLLIPIEVAEVSKEFAAEIGAAKISKIFALHEDDRATIAGTFVEGNNVTIKIPSQISKETLSKIIKIMELVAELKKKPGNNEGYIITTICLNNQKEIQNNIDLILAADCFDCPYILKALILAFKHKMPSIDSINAYSYNQALDEIKRNYQPAKSNIINLDDEVAPLVQTMAKATISDDMKRQKSSGQIHVELKSGEIIGLPKEDGSRTIRLEEEKVQEVFTFEVDWNVGSVDVVISPDGTKAALIKGLSTQLLKQDKENKKWGVVCSESNIYRAAFSPNGNFLAVGRGDGSLWGCDIEKDQFETPFILLHKEHRDPILGIAFNYGQRAIFTASDDSTAKLWEESNGILCTLSGHEGPVNSVAFCEEGKIVATGSCDETAKLWDIDGKCVCTLSGHKDIINSVAFNPAGTLLATGSSDKTVKLWNTRNGECVSSLTEDDDITSVMFSPDGKLLVIECGVDVLYPGNVLVKIYSMENLKCVRTFNHTSLANFDADGRLYLIRWPNKDRVGKAMCGYINTKSS